MLQDLYVKDFAIIDSLHLSFATGLTVITGETGAGKSILVGAVSLLMGGRASSEMIRTGCDEAVAEAVFDIGRNTAVKEALDEYGLESGDDQLLIRRIISRTGKNRILIGGRPATMLMLSRLSGMLIDISGQYSQQLLLQQENHLGLLDAYGGLGVQLAEYRDRFEKFQRLADDYRKLNESWRDAARQKELCAFQLEEIRRAKLLPQEQDALEHERRIMTGSKTLYEKTYGAYEALYESERSCLGTLKRLLRDLREASAIDGSLNELCQSLDSSMIGIEDAALNLRNYAERLENDPSRLEIVEARLDELHRLKKKYGKSVPELIEFGLELGRQIDGIEGYDAAVGQMRHDLQACAESAWLCAGRLSAARCAASRTLQKKVHSELATIGLKKAAFIADVRPAGRPPAQEDPLSACDGLTASGMDCVEFFISPNQGEDPKPLSRIASGGEISRIVLALKKIIAANYKVPTLLFDEVDAGIGGAVAESVGRKLVEIAASHQVLCITHLPQIACYGGQHLCVRKQAKSGRTITCVEQLDSGERIEEISRMLGGLNLSASAKQHASEMLSQAHEFIENHAP